MPAVEAEVAAAGEPVAGPVAPARQAAGEQRRCSSFTRLLPSLARDLNRSDLDERQIPRLVFALVDSIFEPEQKLLYLVRPVRARSAIGARFSTWSSDRAPRTFRPRATKITVGEGKIGWVASAKVEMLAEDWLNMTRTEGRAIEDNHPSLRLDLIGPLVHHDDGKDRLLGVPVHRQPRLASPRREGHAADGDEPRRRSRTRTPAARGSSAISPITTA